MFLGVVGMDVYMDVLFEILGNKSKVTELLQKHISEAKCPTFKKLNETDRDRLRIRIGGEEATCGDFTRFDDNEACDEGSLPEGEELFAETINNGKSQSYSIAVLYNSVDPTFVHIYLALMYATVESLSDCDRICCSECP